jgi:hypothetical protein
MYPEDMALTKLTSESIAILNGDLVFNTYYASEIFLYPEILL